MDMQSDSDSEEQIINLEEIKKHVEKEKLIGNETFVSGWEDDTTGVDEKRNPTDKNATAALEAAENGDLETLRSLIESDPALINVQDLDGYSPLHRASYSNKVDIVEYLISVGANVGIKTEDGWTPLHSACHWNNALCAIKLIEGGVDVNATSTGGQTPLHIAATHGVSKDCLEVLLTHPLIKPWLLNGKEETALDIAKGAGKYSVLFELHEPCIKNLEMGT